MPEEATRQANEQELQELRDEVSQLRRAVRALRKQRDAVLTLLDGPEVVYLGDIREALTTCSFVSASSDDGYCKCILPVGHTENSGRHKCIHGWL